MTALRAVWADRVPGGGAHGPRPTGQVRYPPVGDGVPTSRQRGSAALGYGFPRQCVPQGHLLRGAHWLGMTALRAVWADRVPGGGAHGPRPTGQVRYPPVGDGVPTSRQRGSAALGYGFPRQCVPQGHLLRGAHWLGMTALRAVWADRVPGGGAHGPRPTGRYVEPRETGRRDAVPYGTGRRGRRPLRAGRRPLRAFIL